MARNRIKMPGLYVGSTTDYGSIVDIYEPILVFDSTIKHDKFFSKHITMTRKEFDVHNIYRFLLNSLKDYYPNDTVRKFSMKYKATSSFLHKLIEQNCKRKALD